MCLRVLASFHQILLLNCRGGRFAGPGIWRSQQQLMVVRHAIKFAERRMGRYHSNERKLKVDFWHAGRGEGTGRVLYEIIEGTLREKETN